MSYYWDVVKDMDDSQKLELVTMLIESVKPKVAEDLSMEQMLEGYPYKRYTKEEINAMIDKAEDEIAAGIGIDDDDLWKEDEEELETFTGQNNDVATMMSKVREGRSRERKRGVGNAKMYEFKDMESLSKFLLAM
jgi:hypothetical protein